MNKKVNVFVSKTSDGWSVKSEGSSRSAGIFTTQSAAINKGRKMAVSNKSELRIKGVNGKIRETRSYGNDPFPPRDKK